jgi:hypothetical protein
MRPFGKVALHFAVTVFVLLLLWSPFSVYVLGEYERAWGRGGSVQVLWLLSFCAFLLTLFSSGLGAKAAVPQRPVPMLTSVLAGLAFVLTSAVVLWLISFLGQDIARFIVIGWFVLAPGFTGFFLIKHFGKEGELNG